MVSEEQHIPKLPRTQEAVHMCQWYKIKIKYHNMWSTTRVRDRTLVVPHLCQ